VIVPTDSEPPSSDSERALEECRRLESIGACYVAARKAMGLARTYALEPGSSGRRERECIEEVLRLRRAIAVLRAGGPPLDHARIPGLRKADASGPSPAPAATPKRAG
jgi:hypothetical protein